MRLFRTALLIGAAMLPAIAPARPAPDAAPAVQVKPIDYTERTLPNGLRVYAIRDTSTANVSVQVWYNVGSKDDPKGRSGFAHMFEHLMFKATRNLKDEQFDRLTEDVGGYNNASTNDDFTNYFEVVPANHLQRLLFAEADRMANLAVSADAFASERDVVKEELRSRVLAQPYGKLFYLYFPMASYDKAPYARPGIGSIADLDSATIDDIRAFHATYYRPDNAVLIVSGNFDPAELNQWVDQYFGPIKKPNGVIPRVDGIEGLRDKATSFTVYEPNVPLPAVLISYRLPPASSPDTPALEVLNAILSAGDNSRLYQSLVYRDQVALETGAFFEDKQGTGSAAIYAILAGGKSADDGEKALRAEIAKLIAAAPSDAELAEAKNQLVTGELQGRETAEGKASALAQAIVIKGDARAADKDLAAIQAVTAADVQRVAKLYFADARSAVVRYLPDSAKPADGKSDPIAVGAGVITAALKPPADVPIITPAPDAERVPLPAPGKPVAVAVPKPVGFTLNNGMRVVVVEKHDLPLVTASLVVSGGGALDPADRAGLASLTAELMTKGTKTRSATDIARAVESLGGAISSSADWDGASVDLTVKSDQLSPALAILADVTRNPVFADDEIERARAQDIDAVALELKDPRALSGLIANRAIFGDTPYGHRLGGTTKSLKAITASDIKTAYASSWQPGGATLLLVGDITADQAKAEAEKLFADWKGSASAAPVPRAATAFPAPRVIVVDMPGAGQAGIGFAKPALARASADYYPAIVANAVLGGGYSARLNEEIRVKRGLAYGAGSSLGARQLVGPFAAGTQTKNPSAAEVVAIIKAELDKISTTPITDAELDPRKAVLIGGFGRSIETTGGIANILSTYIEDEIPITEIQRYMSSVQAVDAASASKAAAKYLSSDGASIVVVGDAKQFADALRKVYPDLVVIPADKLNLDSKTLQ